MSSNIEFLLKQINLKLKDSSLFYISNDPERALGLEGLVDSYHIICVDDSNLLEGLKTAGIKYFSLEEQTGELNSLYRNSSKLLLEEDTRKYIEKNKKALNYFQTFKISSRFEKLIEGEIFDGKLLNTNSDLNRLFEEKISQYKALNNDGIQFPKTIIGRLADLKYKSLKKQIGEKLVLQFNRGHTGQGTLFLHREDDFNNIQAEFPERIVRIAEFVNGKAYTVNTCIYMGNVYIAGLSYQITGEKGLTNFEGGTVGNDFNYREGFSEQTYNQLYTQVSKIGERMAENGYRGLFGVDMILDNDGKIFIIEINARQPASIPFATKLQLELDQVPLLLLNLMAFLDIRENIDPMKYFSEAAKPIEASQVFKRNLETNPVIIDFDLKTGDYLIADKEEMRIKFKNYAYNISQIGKDGLLLMTQKKGKRINPGNEILRMQIRQGVISKSGRLKPWVAEVLNNISD
ncbi:ATP-grasp domain-containing protein [Candidatus Dojkabacteria bacterium]|nr:ATP-grasp domain-containing protein [Candidatus Dojkabacteria bacterium]